MILPGLPEGVDLLGYRPVARGEFAWVLGAALPGQIDRPMFVVAALPGYQFQYDVTTDTHIVVSTDASLASLEGVIPSPANAGILSVPMNFDAALAAMKTGKKARRQDWQNRWLEYNERMLPHLAQMPELAVWGHTREDMAARDWVVE